MPACYFMGQFENTSQVKSVTVTVTITTKQSIWMTCRILIYCYGVDNDAWFNFDILFSYTRNDFDIHWWNKWLAPSFVN